VLDIHVFGENEMETKFQNLHVFFRVVIDVFLFWDPKFENSRFGALNIKTRINKQSLKKSKIQFVEMKISYLIN
jgi:hypothetical protein